MWVLLFGMLAFLEDILKLPCDREIFKKEDLNYGYKEYMSCYEEEDLSRRL